MTALQGTAGVGEVARDAVAIDESMPLGQAWHQVHADPERCGVVIRGRMPIAVVTSGDLAERWPGGGPECSWARPVGAVLDRPLGVEILAGDEPLEHGARRVIDSRLPALPVGPPGPGHSWRLVGLREIVAALLDSRGRP